MSPPSSRIGNPAQFGVMFWLPPGGIDNGVPASYWAELADLECCEFRQVLALLAGADIGGYVATPGARTRNSDRPPIHRLWVDSLQYHRAEDILMAYLNNKGHAGESHSATTS